MARLAWMTDIHLDMVIAEKRRELLEDTKREACDALLITGDIGEAQTIREYLIEFVERLKIPVYFILGNHDYYGGSIASVRAAIQQLCEEYEDLHWLPLVEIVELTPDTALIGHGGWSDAGYGDFHNSTITLNDYLQIQELAVHGMDKYRLVQTLSELGEEAGAYLRHFLPLACAKYATVYVALHSPPFPETAWYEGSTPDEANPYLPHFTCKAAGDALLAIAPQYPDTMIHVLCGHTHGDGETIIRANLRVQTGGAEYGEPCIKRIFTF